ncbi:phage tail tube protein [Corallococcus sp. bb12-1]|uniref:phage tail tube protein n=1 Tax=Corallococcus sp. bb12-1 TaxID=2996784 RepID=UPI0022710094|nr:phage tail tube protein [Corallococcus sp. bb12-1]MCY1042130.1 phage tail tube protein [Corallococcus sp. bb12-1]
MPEPREAFFDKLYIRATDTAPVEADALEGVLEAPVNRAKDTVDANYFGSDGWKRSKGTWKSFSIPLSGHVFMSSSPQQVLRDAFESDATVFFTVVEDETAPVGTQGFRYPVKVTSYEEGRSASDVVTFSATLAGQGAPVAV